MLVKQKSKEAYNIIDIWDVPQQEYYDELCRVSDNQIIWGINYYNFVNEETHKNKNPS